MSALKPECYGQAEILAKIEIFSGGRLEAKQ